MNYLDYVYPVMGVGALVGLLFFAFRSGLNTMQQQAIAALKERLDAQDKRIVDLEKENAVQAHDLDLVKSALEQMGLSVTIKGDMVIISGKDGSSSVVKPLQSPPPKAKPRTKTTKAVSVTEESESN